MGDQGQGSNKRERETLDDDDEAPSVPQKQPRTDGLTEYGNLDASIGARLNAMVTSGLLAKDELDRKSLDELATLPIADSIIILDQFERSAGSNVRNKSAYLHGCITRHRQQAAAPSTFHNKALDPRVSARLASLYQSVPAVKASDLDQRVYDFLSSLPLNSAIAAIDRFQAKFTSDVRNIPAFFTSILRSEQQNLDQGRPPSLPGPSGHPPPYSQQGYYPPQAPPQHLIPPPPAPQFPPHPYPYGVPPHQPPNAWAATPPPSFPPHFIPPFPPQHQPGPNGRRHFGAEQARIGVRVNEFHTLSHLAPYVSPNAALRLQYLWDSGITLLSSLDDRTWEALCDLQPNDAVSVIDHVSEVMRREHIRNPAAFFMTQAKRFLISPINGMPSQQNASYAHLLAPPYQATWHPSPQDSSRPGGPSLSAINELPDDMRSRAFEAISKNPRSLNEGNFDSGVVSGLLKISPAQAHECFDELLAVNLTQIRNPTAFIMGMIKKRRS